eukprot:5561618-Prymnesium_polylepis.1
MIRGVMRTGGAVCKLGEMRIFNLSAVLLALLPTAAVGLKEQLKCHATSHSVTDGWCDANCNHSPPNCPPSL